jgi:hypothetical protein
MWRALSISPYEAECLRPHPPLLWLHQLRADDYAGAAATLHGRD